MSNTKPIKSEYVKPKARRALLKSTARKTESRPERQAFDFVEPTLFIPEWLLKGKSDLVYSGSRYVLLPNTTGSEKKQCDVNFFIDVRVLLELQIVWNWAHKNRGEIAWFMPTHRLNDMKKDWLAWGYYITGQKASGGEVEMCGYDSQRYWKYLSGAYHQNETIPKQGIYEHSHVFSKIFHRTQTHGHKHPSGVNNWSGTDMNQQKSIGDLGFKDDYRFYMLFTPPDKLRVDLVIYEPAMFRVEHVNIGLYYPEEAYEISIAKKEEIEKKCESLVKRRHSYHSYTHKTTVADLPVGSAISIQPPQSPYNIKEEEEEEDLYENFEYNQETYLFDYICDYLSDFTDIYENANNPRLSIDDRKVIAESIAIHQIEFEAESRQYLPIMITDLVHIIRKTNRCKGIPTRDIIERFFKSIHDEISNRNPPMRSMADDIFDQIELNDFIDRYVYGDNELPIVR